MANRFPLTIDGSTIKELASGDNLDLTGSGISISSNQGNANQVLISTGSGVAWADASGGSSTFGVSTMTGDGSDTTLTLSANPGSENNTQVYIDGVYQPKSSYSVSGTTLTFSTAPPTGTSVEAIVGASSSAGVPSDASVTSAKLSGALTTPSSLTLGGNLDVSGHDIVTVSNADIELDPNGSGTVIFKGNATKGAGQFKLNCENNSHGITIKGPPHSAAASYTLTLPNTDGSADQVLKTDGSGNLDWVDSGGGGGAWNVISSSTVSSAVSTLEFTSITGYTHYMIEISNLKSSANKELQIECAYAGSSSYAANGYMVNKIYLNWGSAASFVEYQTSQSKARISKDMSSIVGSEAQLWFGNGSSSISFKCASGHVGSSGTTMATGAMANDNSAYRDEQINKMRFSFQSGNIDAGTFTLYGLSTS